MIINKPTAQFGLETNMLRVWVKAKEDDMAKFSVNVGDKVAYSVQFLKSIGMSHSDMARARGTVTELSKLGSETTLARIDWNCDMPERVNAQNLARVGLNTRFSNC
jgi:hypothetical protein